MSDGSIIIDTELNSQGFLRGLARLRKQMEQELNTLAGACNQAGRNMAAGVTAGLESGSGSCARAAASLGKNMVSELKSYLKIHSPSQLMQEEIGKNIALGVAAGINENADEATKAAVALAKASFQGSKEFIEARKYLNQMSLSDELLAWQRVQNQYILGSQQRIEAEQQVYRVRTEILEQIDQKEQAYAQAVDRRAKQLADSFGLFDAVKPLVAVDSEALLLNLNQQVDALRSWEENIAALTQRGISEGLLAQLTAMGPKAAAEIQALLAMTEEQLNTYGALWAEKNALSRQQAILELTGLREDTNQQIALLLQGVEEQFATTPDVGRQLTDGLAQGILQGLSNVVSAAIAVAKAAVAAAKEELQIESPSKVFRQIGLQSDAGLAQGLIQGTNKIQQAATQLQAANPLLAQAPLAPARVSHTIIQEKVVGVHFDGSGADIARLLHPQLIKEQRILGESLLNNNF